MAKHEKVKLTLNEASDMLKHIISNNRFLQANGKKLNAVELQGVSGIGKTSLVLQVAKELGLEVVKVNLSQIEEIGDIVGFPLRQFQMCTKEDNEPRYETRMVEKEVIVNKTVKAPVKLEDGTTVMRDVVRPIKTIQTSEEKVLVPFSLDDAACHWIDENATQDMLSKGFTFTGKKRMSYCPPEWVADKGEGYILLLDDFNRADQI
jgi:hypothetical protein